MGNSLLDVRGINHKYIVVGILKYIQMQINSLDKNIKIEEIVDILKKGDFVIFFDGYDEITNANKPDVLASIQEFASKASNTKIVITSREEDDLNSLGEFKCVNIKPLTNEEAYELIKKYDNDGEISKKLIKRLKEDSLMSVLNEFLENPLLVSLLYKTFEYKEEIPYKKIDFYEQVYAALFNDHDKTKGAAYVHEKKTNLDKYQFELILRTFGFLALKSDKVEYSDQLIHQLLEHSIKRFSWLEISVEEFLYDITHSVPFIQKDGNEYKWVHKSFMEYFASSFICYDNKVSEEKYLKKMICGDLNMKYFNILDFCYEMDTLNFRRYIILPYLEKYMDKYEKSFINNFFMEFNQGYLHLAKQIVASTNDLIILHHGFKIDEDPIKYTVWMEELLTHRGKTIDMWRDTKDFFVIMYSFVNPIMHKFVTEKIPELFEDVIFEQGENSSIKYSKEFYFNDDIDNSINKDKNLFYIIIKILIERIYKNKMINNEKCKRMIDVIRLEESFQNNDIFDL